VHEMSLLADLMRKIEAVAAAHGATRVARVTIRLGALAHVSPAHLRGHFVRAAAGGVAEGAELEIVDVQDPRDPHAQEIVLESVEVEG
jgi:hydrogenase nickel incorporation protein HypA/HybF